jgi:hypothetical protein
MKKPPANDSKKPEMAGRFKRLPADSRERRFLVKFWLRMQELYGLAWFANYGDVPPDTWADALLVVGEELAGKSINALMARDCALGLPTLPEFMQLCESLKPRVYYQAQAKPKPTPDELAEAKANFKRMREIIGPIKKPRKQEPLIVCDEGWFNKTRIQPNNLIQESPLLPLN